MRVSASESRPGEAGARQSCFALFDLAPCFRISLEELDRTYRELAARVHPDRYVRAGPAEQRRSLEASATVNEAYRTLRRPASRARHLLELRGTDALEPDAALPPEFLLEQMEWREGLVDARACRDVHALERILASVRGLDSALRNQLELQLDVQRDDRAAALSVRKLLFVEKLLAELDDVCSLLEA